MLVLIKDQLCTQCIKCERLIENKQHMTVCQTGDLEVAFEIAKFFRETLNINVLDATTNESKWL